MIERPTIKLNRINFLQQIFVIIAKRFVEIIEYVTIAFNEFFIRDLKWTTETGCSFSSTSTEMRMPSAQAYYKSHAFAIAQQVLLFHVQSYMLLQ